MGGVTAPVETCLLGSPELDRLLGAPPDGSVILVFHDPDVPVSPVLTQIVHTQLAQGRHVIWGDSTRIAPSMRPNPRVHNIAWPEPVASAQEGNDHILRLDKLVHTLDEVADSFPGAVLVASLPPISNPHGRARQAPLTQLAEVLHRFHAAVLCCTIDRVGFSEEVLGFVDGVVRCARSTRPVFGGFMFEVVRTSWGRAHDGERVLCRPDNNGIAVYLPKIVVTGPPGAGKSTLIAGLTKQSRNAAYHGVTVSLDSGHFHYDEGIDAGLFGTPGESRFDPLLRVLGEHATGVLLVVDSSGPSSFPRAREMLAALELHDVPVLLVANKQDHPSALAPGHVARLMGLPSHVGFVGAVATNAASARRVLRTLVAEIFQQGGRV